MKRIKAILFGCGTDAAHWLETNCRGCWKGNAYRTEEWCNHSKCGIVTDILSQWLGGDDINPTEKSVKATSLHQCPFREETRPRAKTHRPMMGQLTIQF